MLDGDLRPGTVIEGRFEVVSTLGRGGMGAVHRARDLARGGVEVALKVIRPGLADDGLMARFAREAETAARVDRGEGLARVHATGRSGATWWIAQELVEGRDLAAWLRERPRGPAEVAALLARVARTLGRCHEAGVVHRDVKPQNIMVRSADDAPVLIDFGVAHDGGASRRLTQTGEVVGTPGFMAPEQVDGRPVDGRTDVHALGCVLFWALTGRAPFEGPLVQVLAAVLERSPAWPPSPLAAVGRRALAKDPALRHPTADALADDLLHPGAGPARGRPAGRTVVAVALAAVAVAGAVVAVVATLGRGAAPAPTGATPPSGPAPISPTARRALEALQGGGDPGAARRALAQGGVDEARALSLLDRAMARRVETCPTDPSVVRAFVGQRRTLDPSLVAALVAWVGPAQADALAKGVAGQAQALEDLGPVLVQIEALADPARSAKVAWLAAAATDPAIQWLAGASGERDARQRARALEAHVRCAPREPAAETVFLSRVRDGLMAQRPRGKRRPQPADLAALALDARLALEAGPASAETSRLVGDLLLDGVASCPVEVVLTSLRRDWSEHLSTLDELAKGLDDAVLAELSADRPRSAAVAGLVMCRATQRAKRSPTPRDARAILAAWTEACPSVVAFADAPARDLGRRAEIVLLGKAAQAVRDWADVAINAGDATPRPERVALASRLLERARALAGDERDEDADADTLLRAEHAHVRASRVWGGPRGLVDALLQLRGRWRPADATWVECHVDTALWFPDCSADEWAVLAAGLDAARLAARPAGPETTRVQVALGRVRLEQGDLDAAEAALEGLRPEPIRPDDLASLLRTALARRGPAVAARFVRRLLPAGPGSDASLRALVDSIEQAAAAPRDR